MTPAQQNAVAHYLGKGLSKESACGIVAVLTAESNMNPGSQGVQASETPGALNPSGAFGVASWNGPRQADLKAYATRYSRDPSDILTQLDFVLTEAAGFSGGSNPKGCPSFWAAITSPASHYSDVVTVMVRDFEVPKDPAAEIERATPIAAELMAASIAPETAPATPAPVAAPPAAPPPAPAPAANKQITVVAELVASIMAVLSANGISLQ